MKRQASDPLLSTRPAKHPCTEKSQTIIPRWQRLATDALELVYETGRHLIHMTFSQKPDVNEATPQQTQSPDYTNSLPSRATRSSLPSHLPIPEQFEKPSDPRTTAGSSQLSSSLPSRSESSNLLNGNAASPSTLTGYTSVTSIPSNEIPPYNQSHVRLPWSREHIYNRQHKVKVKEDRKKDREMVNELYHIKCANGYISDLDSLKSLIKYQAHLELLDRHALSPSPSLTDLRAKPLPSGHPRRHSFSDDIDPNFLERALERAKKSFESTPPKPYSPTRDQLRLSARRRDEAIEKRLRPKLLPKLLPPEADEQVKIFLCKQGIISKIARESVNDRDLSRLLPCQWLNDEIINFYGAMILTRSESHPKVGSPTRKRILDVHYFSTFFWPKLKNEGYDKGRLAKWTKKIDIFSKDVILIPINHNNSHWTGAAINFRRKRIESYDSMNLDRRHVSKMLRNYLDSEHKNKKKKSFDFTGWQDHNPEDTPQQENGYDCGVFTCQFLEALSRGEEVFNFSQRDMAYLRRRMIWEIGHARFLDGP